MKNKFFVSTLVVGLLLSIGSYTAPQYVGSLLPENDRRIDVRSAEANSMTEQQFNSLLSFFEPLYQEAFAKKNLKFVVVGRWTDPTVNAYADQQMGTARITIFGGIARHKYITLDGLAAVICHEIGHHLGGAPKVRGWGSTAWASNDGQSDYYATLKCMRTYFKLYTPAQNVEIVRRMYRTRTFIADPLAVTECQKAFQDTAEQAICIRSTAAGISLATTLAELGGSRTPTLGNRDKIVVTTTDDRHPKAQCRLDTYFSGALCPISENVDLDDKDPNVGACNAKAGHPELYHRPRCWFKPNDALTRNRF